MAQKKIIYLCNFDNHDTGVALNTQPSGNSKISYIIKSLKEANYKVHVFSTGIPVSNMVFHRRQVNYDGYCIQYLFSLGHKCICNRLFSTILVYLQITLLWFTEKKDIPFLIYHTPRLTSYVRILNSLCGRHKVFIEIEEIYAVVRGKKDRQRRNEIDSLSYGDGYICVNEHIGLLCSLQGPCVVCHGEYLPKRKEGNTINQNSVRILYAGELGNDAILAIEVARLLPPSFILYILGYGSYEQECKIKSILCDDKDDTSRFVYMGRMEGDQYNRFLSTVNIGICPRVVDSEDSLYAFPSKILSYLSNNLITVSTPLRSIKESVLSQHVVFATSFSAESIANAIMSNTHDGEEINYYSFLNSLHEDFVKGLKKLLS